MDFWEVVLYTVSYFGLYTAVFFLVTLIEHKKELKNPRLPRELPSVTIIVPACNEEGCLAKTVRSLMRLDYPKKLLQIMIVDDGSTDRTLEIARSFERFGVKVLTKPNGGKGTALNLALKHVKSEFVGCLDADSIVMPDALKKMLGYFRHENVVAVTPSLKCTRPRTVWQRIQVIEFMLGVYLRKVFALLGSVHITPGPFTIFRKSFFDTHGGYDESTCTEDTEIAMRIQSLNYEIENCIDANVYAVPMPTFKTMKSQRVRWYKGFLENVQKYRHMMFSPKYGNLGIFVLPSAFLSVLIALVMVVRMTMVLVEKNYDRIINMYNVNFDIWKLIRFDWDWFYINQTPLALIGLTALMIGILMVVLAKALSKERMSLAFSYLLFMLFYLPLYAYWWAVSIRARVKDQDVAWKGRIRKDAEIKYS
jgi:cellulose synthase/poly-beta-1,6-N-acetylglucosamine synthase-like glycosyltransferase